MSWVPKYGRSSDYDQDPGAFPVLWNSDRNMGEHLAIAVSESDPDVLVANGLELDSVFNSRCTHRCRLDRTVGSTSAFVEQVVAAVQKIKPELSVERIAASVLVAGRSVDFKKRAEEDNLSALADLRSLLRDEKRLPPLFSELNAATPSRDRSAGLFDRAMQGACCNRKFFTTASGYVGLGPKIMQPDDDDVVVVYGSQHPFVLRQYGEEYRLVGSCYVEGVMDGEVVQKHQQEGKPIVEFRIR